MFYVEEGFFKHVKVWKNTSWVFVICAKVVKIQNENENEILKISQNFGQNHDFGHLFACEQKISTLQKNCNQRRKIFLMSDVESGLFRSCWLPLS